MPLAPDTLEVLKLIEQATGVPVETVEDQTVSVVAKVTPARAGVPFHLLRINPSRRGADYAIAYECGFILRLYANPPDDRFEFAGSEAGRADVVRMVGSASGVAKRLGLPGHAIPEYARILYHGLMTQLRSMPIGMRIDQWIHETYPGIRAAQASSLNEQQVANVKVLEQQVQLATPTTIYTANVAMNAAYALMCDELFGEGGYSMPYRSRGFFRRGEHLLQLWRETPDDSSHDRALVDAWAKALGLARWYRWVPYSGWSPPT